MLVLAIEISRTACSQDLTAEGACKTARPRRTSTQAPVPMGRAEWLHLQNETEGLLVSLEP